VRTRRARWIGLPLLGVLAGVLSALGPGTGAASAQPTDVRAFMTLYGWADNSPPGPVIAHPCLHAQAGGTGTYADPITFATDVAELAWCQVIYVPYMQRYFVHEDECSECDADWSRYGLYRFDMWAGGDATSVHQPEKRALLRCESTWTRADSIDDPDNPTVDVDPPPGLPVTTAPIFSPSSGCWAGAVVVTNPGRQQTARGTPVSLEVQAQSTISPPQPLSYAATDLPAGLSLDPATGTISGVPTATGRRKVTVTVSDSVDSATATFTWVVRRA